MARYLLADAAVDAATAALVAVSQPESPLPAYDDARHAFNEPSLAADLEEPALQAVAAKCCAALAARLVGTLHIVRDELLNAAWLELPAAALEALLASPGHLVADCEDTVLLLLHRWAVCNAPCPAVRARLLRPLQLSRTYLHHVMPKMEWLGLTPAELADLTFAASSAGAGAAAWTPGFSAREACAWLGTFAPGREPAWLQLRGEGASGGGRGDEAVRGSYGQDAHSLSFHWDLDRPTLEALLAEARARLPLEEDGVAGDTKLARINCEGDDATYMGGFIWGLALRVRSLGKDRRPPESAADAAPEGTHVAAGLLVTVRFPSGIHELDVATTSTPALGIEVETPTSAADGAALYRSVADRRLPLSRSRGGFCWADYFMASGALDAASWEPFVVDGCVRIMATVALAGVEP